MTRLRNVRTGRPRKEPDERRDASLPPVRVTAAELAHVEAQAAQAGVAVSEFVRTRAVGGTVTQRRAKSDDRAIYELNRIGNNLNQIAHAAHLGKPLEGKLADALDQLTAAMDKVAGDGS